ncbi:MAG TPA: ABC transporter permease [Gemmatimonadales bacterium]|nr:ABC transporter permease [Gemmatimonadales bacterium]
MTDLLGAIRSLRRAPGYAAASLLTLGLGLGAVTAIFSVVHSVLLAPLPYRAPERLYVFTEQSTQTSRLPAFPAFLDYQRGSRSFEGLGYIVGESAGLRTRDGVVQMVNARVSPGFFQVLGATPILGRTFATDDEAAGASPVAVLSHAFWRGQFAGDPAVIGKTLDTGAGSFTVIGVLPAGAGYPTWAQVYTPLAAGPAAPAMSRRDVHVDGGMLARLRAGVDSATAARELEQLGTRLAEAYPAENAGFHGVLTPMRDAVTGGGSSTPLLLLLAATALLLVMACVNVASLGLARVTNRTREMALRTALGAGRGRLVRQLLGESVLLALAGAGLGLLLASWLVRLLTASDAGNLLAAGVAGAIPRLEEVRLDAPVFLTAFALTLLAGIAAGLLPALAGSRPDLAGMLRRADSKGSAAGAGRTRRVMIATQTALALALLVSAALLANSFWRVTRVDRGFQSEGVLTVHIAPGARYAAPGSNVAGLYTRLAERVGALPGVTAVGLINHLPLAGSWNGTRLGIDGAKPAEGEELTVGLRVANPAYLEAMRVPLLKGRWFTAADMGAAAGPIVINRRLAERYWPGKDPIGHRISFYKAAAGRADFGEPVEGTVVGVVGDVRQFGLDRPSDAAIYLPYTVNPWGHIFLTVRASVAPGSLLEPLRRTLLAEDPDLVLTTLTTMDDLVSGSLAPREFLTLLVGIFAAAALGLATIGLYGVLSRLVRSREREIGIRRAVGADEVVIMRLVFREGMGAVLAGSAAGMLLAAILGRALASVLFGVTPGDLPTYLAALALLLAVALLACYLPARRAARIDPTVALSSE